MDESLSDNELGFRGRGQGLGEGVHARGGGGGGGLTMDFGRGGIKCVG